MNLKVAIFQPREQMDNFMSHLIDLLPDAA
jgi:hypothetical protein